jgi:uncharacterized protein
MIEAIFALIILILSVVVPNAAAPLNDAVSAAHQGDYATAHQVLRPLAEGGNPRAQFNLAYLYANGFGVRRDYTEAVKWYRNAADQGLANAQNSLGVEYFNGDGVSQNFGEAVRWFRRAANQNFTAAQFNLGYMYANGLGVPKDLIAAGMWIALSTDRINYLADKSPPKQHFSLSSSAR